MYSEFNVDLLKDAPIIGIVLLVALPLAARFCRHHSIPDNMFHGMLIIHVVTTVSHLFIGGDWRRYYHHGYHLAKENADFGYVKYGSRFIDVISHAIQSVVDISPAGMFAIF